jgi:ubiquinone/menaquinone biosynthesis C-methylase UbiE
MESASRTETVAPGNEEATEAWSGVLFDRFVEFRDLMADGLARFGVQAMQLHPPREGDRVLDIGCGFGDSTQDLARLVAPGGRAVGVDVSEPFVRTATGEARDAGIANIEFMTGDVQVVELQGPSTTSSPAWA